MFSQRVSRYLAKPRKLSGQGCPASASKPEDFALTPTLVEQFERAESENIHRSFESTTRWFQWTEWFERDHSLPVAFFNLILGFVVILAALAVFFVTLLVFWWAYALAFVAAIIWHSLKRRDPREEAWRRYRTARSAYAHAVLPAQSRRRPYQGSSSEPKGWIDDIDDGDGGE